MLVLFLFLVGAIKAVFFSNFGLGLVDEGQSLHTALKLLGGSLPYRDFFAVFPPLHYYLYALPSWVLGPSIFAPRLLTSFIFACSPALVYVLCRYLTPAKIAVFPALLLIIINPNVDRLYFLTFILTAVYLAVIRKQPFLAGLAFGLSCWFRIDITLTFFAAYCLFAFPQVPRLLLGLSLPIFMLAWWLMAHNLVSVFITNAILEPISITRQHDLPWPSPINLQSAYLTYVFYLVLVTYGVAFIYLLRHPRPFRLLGFWLAAGLLALPYILGRTDMGHLIKGGIPFFILGPFFLHRLFTSPKQWFNLGGWILVVGLFSGSVVESLAWLNLHNQSAVIGRDHLRLPATYLAHTTYPSATTITTSVAFLRSSPTGHIAALPYMAGLYYLAGHPSPTRYDNVLYGYLTTPGQEQDFVAQLAAAGVDRVVYDPIGGPKTRVTSMAIYNSLVHNYLLSNYTITATTPEGWLFLVRHD